MLPACSNLKGWHSIWRIERTDLLWLVHCSNEFIEFIELSVALRIAIRVSYQNCSCSSLSTKSHSNLVQLYCFQFIFLFKALTLMHFLHSNFKFILKLTFKLKSKGVIMINTKNILYVKKIMQLSCKVLADQNIGFNFMIFQDLPFWSQQKGYASYNVNPDHPESFNFDRILHAR